MLNQRFDWVGVNSDGDGGYDLPNINVVSQYVIQCSRTAMTRLIRFSSILPLDGLLWRKQLMLSNIHSVRCGLVWSRLGPVLDVWDL